MHESYSTSIDILRDMDNMHISVSHETLTCTRRRCASGRGNDPVQSCIFCVCCFSQQIWIMINLAKMPPHGELFERWEKSCCGVETGPIAACLGISLGSIQAEWQLCTWLKVTATSGRPSHYFPTQSPWGERAWSDRPQSALHYHLLPPLR